MTSRVTSESVESIVSPTKWSDSRDRVGRVARAQELARLIDNAQSLEERQELARELEVHHRPVMRCQIQNKQWPTLILVTRPHYPCDKRFTPTAPWAR